LCFGNNSLDEMLWKLGPVTLVEYKNEKNNFSCEKAKKIIQTMSEKSSNSAILFLKKGITKNARKEIDEQLMYGKYIIVITKNDLDKIGTKTPYELLTKKIKQVENRQEKLMENLI
jgi:vacuolar-type H+-ATPase subunit F/Vma7